MNVSMCQASDSRPSGTRSLRVINAPMGTPPPSAFADHKNVRLHVVEFAGPGGAASAETGLYFVHDQQHVVFAADSLHFLIVVRGI